MLTKVASGLSGSTTPFVPDLDWQRWRPGIPAVWTLGGVDLCFGEQDVLKGHEGLRAILKGDDECCLHCCLLMVLDGCETVPVVFLVDPLLCFSECEELCNGIV
jgi:hypothetical protein